MSLANVVKSLMKQKGLSEMDAKKWLVQGYNYRLSNVGDGEGEATDLQRAADNGDLEEVERLVEAGADMNESKDEASRTPLYLAANQGFDKVVKYLLEQGADPNKPNFFGANPLLGAISQHQDRNINVTLLLVKGGAFIDQPDFLGETPLTFVEHAYADNPEEYASYAEHYNITDYLKNGYYDNMESELYSTKFLLETHQKAGKGSIKSSTAGAAGVGAEAVVKLPLLPTSPHNSNNNSNINSNHNGGRRRNRSRKGSRKTRRRRVSRK